MKSWHVDLESFTVEAETRDEAFTKGAAVVEQFVTDEGAGALVCGIEFDCEVEDE